MISNRQGGRRRGRGGGGRAPGAGGNVGNRQDNRQRGNAAQLLEKYRGLARDAQMSGDRIQSEYYLQFADHYYRVLNENRARFEEQRRQRGDYDAADDEDEDQDNETAAGADSGDSEEESGEGETSGRGEPRGRRTRGRRREANGDANGEDGEPRIALDSLPPSIGAATASVAKDEGEEAPRPRRRTRRPADDAGEIAPAA